MRVLAGCLLVLAVSSRQTIAGEDDCGGLQQRLEAAQSELAAWHKWRSDNWLDDKHSTKAEYVLQQRLAAAEKRLRIASVQPSQAKPPQPSDRLQIGTFTLRLGMAKDAIIPALTVQFDVTADPPPSSSPSLTPTRSYSITPKNSNTLKEARDLVGNLFFDAQERLVAAEHIWASGAKAGETADSIIALFGSLKLEGNTACSIGIDQFSLQLRDALVVCGEKRIRISSNAASGHSEVIEEIGNPMRAFI